MNEMLVNTKASLKPLVLTSLSKLLPRLLTINKIDESEFQLFLLVICQSVAFIKNSLYTENIEQTWSLQTLLSEKPFEGVLTGFLRPSCHIRK